MRKILPLAIAAIVLTSCNTVEGVKQDARKVGSVANEARLEVKERVKKAARALTE